MTSDNGSDRSRDQTWDDSAPEGSVRVRVPASSANLGPGFDVLAAAIDVPLKVTAVPFDGHRVVVAGEGTGDVARDDDNLIWRSIVAFCATHGADLPHVTLRCDNHIPLQRGLGSSAAAVVAGLALARQLTGVAVGDHALIDQAAELEGHPDNAAAAVLGGVVVAGHGAARRFEPSRNLRPVVCIPAQRASTVAARGLVPAEVPLGSVIDTTRRTALVLSGLTGSAAWDPTAMRDTVHEPPRLAAMPASRALVDEVRAAGHAACLSGAGPSVLVVIAAEDGGTVEWLTRIAGDAWRIVPSRWDRAGTRIDRSVAALT